MSGVRDTCVVLPRALQEYFHDARHSWSFDMKGNGYGDAKIEVFPRGMRTIAVTKGMLERSLGNRGAFFEHIVRAIEDHQGNICDELDRSIRREPRPETKEEHRGRCRYCGAPWEPEERRKR